MLLLAFADYIGTQLCRTLDVFFNLYRIDTSDNQSESLTCTSLWLSYASQTQHISSICLTVLCRLQKLTEIYGVRSLSIVLQDIEDELSLPDLNAKQKSELEEIIVGCRDVLGKLQRALSTYGEFKCDSRGVGYKANFFWKRFQWEPDDIKELRSRVTTNVTFLNAFRGKYTNETLHEIKNRADQFHERQDDRELNKESLTILDSLTLIDHTSQQHDCITKRQADTGKRLSRFASVHRMGKTILTSIVEERINPFRNDKSVGIAYFCCNFRRQHDQKIDDLLLSLLKQLLGYQPSLPAVVKDIFNLHSPRQNRPSAKEISSTLKSMIGSYSKVFIIVDALYECQMANGCRMQFLSEIFDIQETCQLSLFSTSRHIPDIEKRFDSSMRLEIRASDKDVERYLDGRISQLPEYVQKRTDLQNEVKTAIITAIDGMFLLARLNFDSLRGKQSPKAMRNALNSLPTGSDAYRDAYKDAMERIEGRLDDERDLAKQVLLWITCAKRPLTTAELQEAIAVEINESELDETNFSEISTMISVCAGLVVVDDKKLLLHSDKLKVDLMNSPGSQAEYIILDPNVINQGRTPLSYAAENGHEKVVNLLLKMGKVEIDSRDQFHQTPFFHAVENGNKNVVKLLLDTGKVDVNFKDGNGGTPLYRAARFGNEKVVKLLLEIGKVEIDTLGKLDTTPLLGAVRNGHESIVKLLLDRGAVDINRINYEHRTPISYAAERGFESMVKLFLNTNSVDVNVVDSYHRTPISYAAQFGSELMVKLLLDTGKIDIGYHDSRGLTPFSYACIKRSRRIIKLLLNTGKVDLNHKDENGMAPLWLAASAGYEAVVKQILQRLQ
ncbi:hypothetical protein BPOR_0426g00080 [Botrytis porri]|uniref:Uncharacterized protein n=1 Tax=Botrytis porri TaxID=87229 RepID=A0A4Z1KGE7_9HELO|nr:hypothetical protein BPOR_0426g00080 [Botrytis porri]